MESLETRIQNLEERLIKAQTRARAMAALAAAVVIGSGAIYVAPRATAQGKGVEHGIAHRVKTLEQKVAALQTDLAAETAARIAADVQLQNNINAEAAARAAADVTLQGNIDAEAAARAAADTTLQSNIDAEAAARAAADTTLQGNIDAEAAARAAADVTLQSQISPLANILQPFSRVGNDIFITGANLNILNGAGATASTNGLGNLIIGYNEGKVPANQAGSHNIAVGIHHIFTSYGGLIAGELNTISAPYASVTGGVSNAATALHSSVGGGLAVFQGNIAGWSAGSQSPAGQVSGNFRSP